MSKVMHEFKVGDKVIINPSIQIDSNKEGLTFSPTMLQAGIFTVTELSGKFIQLSNGYFYASEWLLPIPMYKIGDKVTVRTDLKEVAYSTIGIRFGVNDTMARFAGKTVTIAKVELDHYGKNLKLGEDGVLYKIAEDEYSWSWPSTAFIINQFFKHYENQLQREKVVVSRGDRPEGRRVCCRRVKAAITIGHLSYKEISGE